MKSEKKIKKKLKKIAERLYWGLSWTEGDTSDEAKAYVAGIIEGSAHITACDIVQNIFPLMNINDGLATCDVIDILELMEPKTKQELYDGLCKLLELANDF